MGNGSSFMIGKFDEYVTVKYVAGVKVITKRNKKKGEKDNTPYYSHTPNTIYARRNDKGKVVQIAVYENNRKIKDIEWGHKHGKYNIGTVHVQEYDEQGNRNPIARDPTPEELMIANKVREVDKNE